MAPYLVYLRNSCNLSKYACLQLAVNLGNACLQLVFIVVLGLGLIGALAGAMIPALLLLIYILAHELSFKFKAPDWKVLKPSLRYAAPLLIFSIFYTLEERLDRLVMEHFLSLDILGPYGVLVAVLGIFPIFLNTLDNAVRPHLFTYLSRNSYKVTGQLQSYSVIYISSSLVALSSILLIGTNLSIFSNEQRYLDIFSWFAFGVLAITPLIVTRYYALFYDYYKRSRELVFWMICRAAITFLLLFTLVPKYGI
ncbi:MAG: oligosaccharide flippase family protein, partial [Phycisphaerae bacterium]|nr:oligosaccharide flippase family protein [Phycisphaerae bacterium]